MPRSRRRPHHAGTWYEKNGLRLSDQLRAWIEQAAGNENEGHAQAIIAPHAGYAYCGHVMAHAYGCIDKLKVDRVFLLGPSHHRYTDRCMLSSADSYQTPLGDLQIDEEIYATLKTSGVFEVMDMATDEAEHSLELHTPYIQFVLSGKQYKLIPIVVGALSIDMETAIAEELSTYLDDPANLFVISSDFCHWGSRFRYTPYDEYRGPIWKYIEWLDHEGIRAIEKGDAMVFRRYLQQTGNTICGRHPIGLFLKMMQLCPVDFRLSFLFYDQSSKCLAESDSSVSYAAGVVRRKMSDDKQGS